MVKIYRSLCSIPSLVGAKLANDATIINTVWSQRNLEKSENTKFMRSIGISTDLSKKYESLPLDVTTE